MGCGTKPLVGRLYVELTAAFVTVVRELAMYDKSADIQAVRELGNRHNLPPELVDLIIANVQQNVPTPLEQVGADPCDAAALKDLHTGTWFCTSDTMPAADDQVICTTIGARQGCALGAMCFNTIYEQALQAIRRDLR